MLIEVSIGEIFDKISILEIKLMKIKDPEKSTNIQKEYLYLLSMVKSSGYDLKDAEYAELSKINQQIWEAEESIRAQSSKPIIWGDQESDIAEVAKKIHQLNDERARIKKSINLKYSSKFIEEKSYEGM